MNLTALLASFPSPDRGVWHLGPVPIRAYALCIIVGIVVAIWWGERRFVARGGAPGTMVDIAVWAVPFGLVGGRIYHVLTDWSKYFGDGGHPVDALKIWQGGLGIWGAISLGALGAWIGARRKGVPLTAVADAAAPGIAVAQAIGRLGNWFNQELYGKATSLPWGLEIFRRVDPVTGEQDTLTGIADGGPAIAVVHPTFLYELLWDLAVAGIVVWADRRFRLGRGRAFALYVAAYTAGRFWIEMLRVDPATMVGGVRINVFTSVVLFVASMAYLLLVRGPREVLGPQPGTEPAGAEPAETEPEAETAGAEPAETAAAPETPGAAEPLPATAGAAAPANEARDAHASAGAGEVPAASANEARDAHASQDEARDAHASAGAGDAHVPGETRDVPAERGEPAAPAAEAGTGHTEDGEDHDKPRPSANAGERSTS